MKTAKKVAAFFSKNMAIIAIILTVFAYFVENSFTSWVVNSSFLNGISNVNNL